MKVGQPESQPTAATSEKSSARFILPLYWISAACEGIPRFRQSLHWANAVRSAIRTTAWDSSRLGWAAQGGQIGIRIPTVLRKLQLLQTKPSSQRSRGKDSSLGGDSREKQSNLKKTYDNRAANLSGKPGIFGAKSTVN